jgi:hypothetical protein
MKKLFLYIILCPFIGFSQAINLLPNSLQLPLFAVNPTCTAADKGKQIYNTTLNQTLYCTGTAWIGNDWKTEGNKTIFNNPSGLIGIGTTNPMAKIDIQIPNVENSYSSIININNQSNSVGLFVLSERSSGIIGGTRQMGSVGVTGNCFGEYGYGILGSNFSHEYHPQSAGVYGIAYFNGFGVQGSIQKSGIAVYGEVQNISGVGSAALFENKNPANNSDVFTVRNSADGNLAVFQKDFSNVARIDKTGKGFFNGGTQASGADLAEAFDIEGNKNTYETGDVLVISEEKDRAVKKSTNAYSDKVAGVYATKPGVLLTEENIDSELFGMIPMGVVGVIPTRVSIEGGLIKRGDLLVTSSVAGVAMKADLNKIRIGQCIGKALENYSDESIAKIKVLVNVK